MLPFVIPRAEANIVPRLELEPCNGAEANTMRQRTIAFEKTLLGNWIDVWQQQKWSDTHL
eukprot:2829764-Amphidinium_carterae.1